MYLCTYMPPKLYHQRQQGSYCRMHSLNNLIGREIVKLAEFDKYCDELDKENGFKIQCSKNYQEFFNNGGSKGIENIFGYTLEKKGIHVRIIGYDRNRKESIKIEDKNDLLGVLCLSEGHVWAIRYYDNKFYIIDSLNGSQSIVDESYFNNKKIVFLFVYDDLDLLSKLDLDD